MQYLRPFITASYRHRLLPGFFLIVISGLITAAIVTPVHAQDPAGGPLNRNQRNPYPQFIIRPNSPVAELFEVFSLTRKANSGDAVAQHNLGICYLEGFGTVPDTNKAAYWILQAARQGHAVANFNMAVLYMNGWGVPWNPFEAYKGIRYAAQAGMKEAQYYLSRFLLEDLVVPRNIDESYRWIKLAADSGYAPAKEILPEYIKRGWVAAKAERTPVDGSKHSSSKGKQAGTTAKNNASSGGKKAAALAPVFLSFSHDTVSHPDYATLVREALDQGKPPAAEGARKHTPNDTAAAIDSLKRREIIRAADLGSPEALVLIGQWYETGNGVARDPVTAAAYYLRALRLDSPRASKILWDLTRSKELFSVLQRRVTEDDAVAQFVWPELVATGFDRSLADEQAWTMLLRSAAREYPPALIAVGSHALAGSWTKKDPARGLRAWQAAADRGSREAAMRILMSKVFNGEEKPDSSALLALDQEADDGSILAQLLLGYCCEHGLGTLPNDRAAAEYYRAAAGRGSIAALDGLRRIYDALRPARAEFKVND